MKSSERHRRAQTLRGLVSGAKPAAKPEPRQPQPKPREPPPKLAPRGGDDSYLGGMDLPSSESESDEERERYRPNYTPEDKATHLQTSVRSLFFCPVPWQEASTTAQNGSSVRELSFMCAITYECRYAWLK